MCPDTILRRQDFLRITCQICYNHLCQICYKPSFCWKFQSNAIFFEKRICLLDRSWNHHHSFLETVFYGNGAKCPHVVPPRVSRNYETFCSLFAQQTGEAAPNVSCHTTKQLSCYWKFAKLKMSAIPKTFCVFKHANETYHHHHHLCHRHHHLIINLAFTSIISHRKISRWFW